MKKYVLPIALLIGFISFNGCKKEEGCMDPSAINYESDAEKDDGSCTFNGRVTFWNDIASNLCTVVVLMADNTSGNITVDHTAAPSCGEAGTFTYTAAPGTYSYEATELDCDGDGLFKTWSGTATITSDGCLTLRLL